MKNTKKLNATIACYEGKSPFLRVVEDFISSRLKIGRAAKAFRMQRLWNGARVKSDRRARVRTA
jgi:hypothetical protein